MVRPCINPVTMDQGIRVRLLEIAEDVKQQSRNVYFCTHPSGILVHSVHTLRGIPVIHGQCYIQFPGTTTMSA
jgi:hypothetical protein